MKKGQVFNLIGNCLGFILAFLFLSTSCSEERFKFIDISNRDTITLPFRNPQVWNVYYHPVFKTTILTFIQESPLTIVSIDTETLKYITFPLDKVNNSILNLSHPLAFYVIDSSYAIINFLNLKDRFVKIDREGNIKSFIPIMDQRHKKDYGLYYYNTIIPYITPSSNDTVTLVQNFTADFPGNYLYITDVAMRNKKFSAKTNLVLQLSDSLIIVSDEIGDYPKELINSQDFYYYEPCYSIGADNQLINIFPSINKIGLTKNKNTEFQNINIPNTDKVSTFNSKSVMNYQYISEYTYMNSIWLYIYSDLRDSCYYAISTIQSKFINEDGTRNNPSSSPWALVKLDKALKIKKTIFFDKDDLSKHNFFFSSKYMYFLSNTLTKENPQKYMKFIKVNKYQSL